MTNVDAICVWAIPRSCNCDIFHYNVVAALQTNMEGLTVYQGDVADSPIRNIREL